MQADKADIPEDAVSVVTGEATVFLPLTELVDIKAEIERLEKEAARLEGEIKRSNGMLNNDRFLSKAPEAKVAEERAKLAKYEGMKAEVEERLSKLRK